MFCYLAKFDTVPRSYCPANFLGYEYIMFFCASGSEFAVEELLLCRFISSFYLVAALLIAFIFSSPYSFSLLSFLPLPLIFLLCYPHCHPLHHPNSYSPTFLWINSYDSWSWLQNKSINLSHCIKFIIFHIPNCQLGWRFDSPSSSVGNSKGCTEGWWWGHSRMRQHGMPLYWHHSNIAQGKVWACVCVYICICIHSN